MLSTLHQQRCTLLTNTAPLLQENLCLLRRTMLWEVSYIIILILHIFIDYKFKIEFFYSDIVPEDVFKDKVVRLQDQEYGTIRYNIILTPLLLSNLAACQFHRKEKKTDSRTTTKRPKTTKRVRIPQNKDVQ